MSVVHESGLSFSGYLVLLKPCTALVEWYRRDALVFSSTRASRTVSSSWLLRTCFGAPNFVQKNVVIGGLAFFHALVCRRTPWILDGRLATVHVQDGLELWSSTVDRGVVTVLLVLAFSLNQSEKECHHTGARLLRVRVVGCLSGTWTRRHLVVKGLLSVGRRMPRRLGRWPLRDAQQPPAVSPFLLSFLHATVRVRPTLYLSMGEKLCE